MGSYTSEPTSFATSKLVKYQVRDSIAKYKIFHLNVCSLRNKFAHPQVTLSKLVYSLLLTCSYHQHRRWKQLNRNVTYFVNFLIILKVKYFTNGKEGDW